MSGTPNLEGIAGTKAAIEYIAGLSQLPETESLRTRIQASFQAIEVYEKALLKRLLDGLKETDFRILGIEDVERIDEQGSKLIAGSPDTYH